MTTTSEVLMSALADAVSINDDDLVIVLQDSTGPGTGTARLMSGTQLFTYVKSKLLPTPSSASYANDAAAAAGGVPVGTYYRNGNFIMVRLA